jgi:hypothetical protein
MRRSLIHPVHDSPIRQPIVRGTPSSNPFWAVLKPYNSSVILEAVRTKTMLPYVFALSLNVRKSAAWENIGKMSYVA